MGYNSTYHAGQVYKDNPRDADMWVEAYRAKFHGEGKPFGKEEFDQLLGHCMVSLSLGAAICRGYCRARANTAGDVEFADFDILQAVTDVPCLQ